MMINDDLMTAENQGSMTVHVQRNKMKTLSTVNEMWKQSTTDFITESIQHTVV